MNESNKQESKRAMLTVVVVVAVVVGLLRELLRVASCELRVAKHGATLSRVGDVL
jgi:hypothetical protein